MLAAQVQKIDSVVTLPATTNFTMALSSIPHSSCLFEFKDFELQL